MWTCIGSQSCFHYYLLRLQVHQFLSQSSFKSRTCRPNWSFFQLLSASNYLWINTKFFSLLRMRYSFSPVLGKYKQSKYSVRVWLKSTLTPVMRHLSIPKCAPRKFSGVPRRLCVTWRNQSFLVYLPSSTDSSFLPAPAVQHLHVLGSLPLEYGTSSLWHQSPWAQILSISNLDGSP